MDTDIIPKISVIMPVYNAERYVFEAIDSILTQTLPDFELLIINDGSIDESEKIILSITDKRIRYFKNEQNLGIIATRNCGLQLARGAYIAMMDADDISLPQRLEKQYAFMSANPLAGVCGAVMQFTGNKSGLFGGSENVISAFTKLMAEPPFGQSTAFIRKSVLDTFSLQYAEGYPHAEDYKLWLDIAKHSPIFCLPETLVHYRWHTANDSRLHQKFQQKTSLKIQQDWFEFVLNRKLGPEYAEIFNGASTLKKGLYYNLLCFQTVKNACVLIDKKIVMERRMRSNIWMAEHYVGNKMRRLLFPLRIIDKLISKIIIHFVTNKRI